MTVTRNVGLLSDPGVELTKSVRSEYPASSREMSPFESDPRGCLSSIRLELGSKKTATRNAHSVSSRLSEYLHRVVFVDFASDLRKVRRNLLQSSIELFEAFDLDAGSSHIYETFLPTAPVGWNPTGRSTVSPTLPLINGASRMMQLPVKLGVAVPPEEPEAPTVNATAVPPL